MATTVAAALVVIAASAVVGHALWRLSGLERSWAAAPAGLAALLAAAAVAVELPGRSVTAAVVLAVIVAASAVAIRGDVTSATVEAAALSLILLALACIPFAVSGHAGVLGVGVNNDMDPHLTTAWWLQTHAGVSKLAPTGYPLGPHAFAAALGTALRFSIPAAFTGLTIAVPALTALAALGAMRGAPAAARWLGSVLVGIAYLASAYLAQGAFKETLQALFVLGFALALREVTRPHSGIALGALVAGMISTYSYFGVLWPVATVVVLAALSVLLNRRLPLRRTASIAAACVVALALAVAGQAGRMITFSSSHYAHESPTGHGNLYHPLPAVEALGIWPTGDFRFHPHPFWITELLLVVAGLALALSLVWWLARRDLAVPAALAAAAIAYWQATVFKNPYNAAKALAVASPLVVLALAVPFAKLVGVRGARPRLVLALRDARVGPSAHPRELDALRHVIGHDSVLFLVSDDFARWELRGTHVATVKKLYATWVLPARREKPWLVGGLIDFDSVSPASLDRVRYVITTRAAYASSPPENFHAVRRTRSYVLWERRGPTPPRSLADERNAPGGILHCSAVPARNGVAAVIPRPIVQTAWSGTTHFAGDTARTTLRLPRGTWDLSLQYVARQGLRFRTRDLDLTLPANVDRLGPYWPVGTIRLARPTAVHVGVRSREVTWLGRLLGARGETRGLRTNLSMPLGALAVTRHAARPRLIPLRRACGRYIDWYRLTAAKS